MEYTSTVTLGGWRERLGSLSVRREELDDKELVARTLSGDVRSYEELVGRYERLVGRVVYPYARREISVEDLVQETFLRAYDRLETFNPDYRFKTWLLAIANNLGVDTLRRRREIVEFNPEAHAPVSESPESDAVDRDPARGVRRAADPALHRGSELCGDSRGALHLGPRGEEQAVPRPQHDRRKAGRGG
jgi:RNA polymerase sigma-70 factor (ECF subfamily)